MVAFLGIFGVMAVLGGYLGGKMLQRAVEERSPSPTATVTSGAEPSDVPTDEPAQTPVSPSPWGEGFTDQVYAVITPKGAVLRPSNGRVSANDPENGCERLIRPGWEGECWVGDMAGSTTAWVVETKPLPGLAVPATSVRVLTLSTELNGWVEQLHASDPDGASLAAIRVVERDLTGDGKPELVVGYRYQGSGGDLGTDVVVNDDGVPVVAAHPDDAVHGSVVFRGRDLIQYMADPGPGDSNCCPSKFKRRTIAYEDGEFRVVQVSVVGPGEVPASAL